MIEFISKASFADPGGHRTEGFHDGRALARADGRHGGFLDHRGHGAIAPRFGQASNLSARGAIVGATAGAFSTTRKGPVDVDGTVVVRQVLRIAGCAEGGFAAVLADPRRESTFGGNAFDGRRAWQSKKGFARDPQDLRA